jgi:sulfatase-modifying factor enzyme 1
MSLLIAVALFCAGQSSLAQLIGEPPIPPHPNNTIPDYDFEWVVINRPGNVAYDGEFWDPGTLISSKTKGRGSVPYTYRISMVEFTTNQYIEFFNTFAPFDRELSRLLDGVGGGFFGDPFYFGPGQRFVLDNSKFNPGMIPIRGISWRQAAMYCNWLHNGKSSDPATLHSGVYDTSTFTRNANNTVNDQSTHSPGARFWIPSLDEWLKAVHFDPNRFGVDQSGWWQYPQGSNTPPISGLPDEGGTTSKGIDSITAVNLPLRSYLNVRSPWGLWDTSGASSEHTEEWDPTFGPDIHFARVIEGAGFNNSPEKDSIEFFGKVAVANTGGFRIAGAVQPRADMNGDLFINAADLAYLLQRWGTNDTGADINGDGLITGADLGLMLGAWGR